MVHVLRSRVVGPLESYAEGFAGELARQGYTVGTASHQLGLIAHLGRWMAERKLDVADLMPVVVERYVSARRVAGYRNLWSAKALVPLLGYLRRRGVVLDLVTPRARTSAEVRRIGSMLSTSFAAGASLAEIGQVLRHRRPLTTSAYAKVDVEALRALARPWPTGGAS